MTSTESSVIPDEENAKAEQETVKNEHNCSTPVVNNGQTDKEQNKTIPEPETDEKHPFPSVQIVKKQEENTELSNQNEESFDKTETVEGQHFEVFNETECMKFAEKFHKIVEELKMNRISERENELRIQKLMKEKSNLERVKDEEVTKNNELIQKHSQKHDEARKQYEEKLQSFQEGKTKHMLEKQSGEKEIKALKDEIRALHITKYTMERLIKDQERQLQSHGTNNANYLTQLAKLEQQCKDVFKQCSHIITSVDKVEANVNASMKLNKKLTFINEHQNCILEVYKEKLDRKQQDLITLEARKASSSNEESDTKESQSLVHLEDELRMQKELCHQVQLQLNDTRQENQELLKSLNSTHELLEKHVDTNNKFVKSDAIAQLELDELRTECEKLKEEIKTRQRDVEEKEARVKEAKTAQEEKEKELDKKIEQLKADFESLRKEKVSLEQLNSKWSQKTVEQREEIEKINETISELESAMEGAKKEMEIQCVQGKMIEIDLKNEVTRYEDLLQKAQQETSDRTNETIKLRERTAELQENEQKTLVELERVKSEKEIRRQENQFVQTEIIETNEKGTNTIASDLQSTTMSRQTTILSENENTSGEPCEPKNVEQNVQRVQELENAQQDSSPKQQNDYIPGKHGLSTDTDCGKDLAAGSPQQDVGSSTEGQGDIKNTPLAKSVGEITNLAQDIKYQEKSVCVQNVYNAERSIKAKHITSGDLTTSAEVKQTSMESTRPTLKTTTNEKQLPSLQETSSLKSPSLKRVSAEKELTTRGKVSCEENTAASSENKNDVSTSNDVELQESMFRSRITGKRTPLLAVVKPTLSSQGIREENIGASLMTSVVKPLQGNSMTRPEATMNTILQPYCVVVQSLPTQSESQNKAAETQGSGNNKSVDKVDELLKPAHFLPQATTSDLPQKQDASATKDDTRNKSMQHASISSDNPKNIGKNDDKGQRLTTPDTPQEDKSTAAKAQCTQDNQMDSTAGKTDTKVARMSGVEEFCFSDEEQESESMPTAIGSQIDRIEAFLKNDRLRLCKKRKISNEQFD